MTQTPFRDFLQEKHAEDYHGTDDGMPDSFDAWLSNLQVDDFLEYGDEFVFTLPKAGKGMKEQLQKEVEELERQLDIWKPGSTDNMMHFIVAKLKVIDLKIKISML